VDSIIQALRSEWELWLEGLGIEPGEQMTAHWQAFKAMVDGALVVIEHEPADSEAGPSSSDF
jgi:hypothetical protein